MNEILIPGSRSEKFEVTLICFPHMGGNAYHYNTWTDILPTDVRVLTYQPPGRATRIRENPFYEIKSHVDHLLPHLSVVTERPCLFFGHSFGAIVAFECLLALRRNKFKLPNRIILSAAAPPSPNTLREACWLRTQSDSELFDQLVKMGGVPEQLLSYKDAFMPIMPTIRAELWSLNDYRFDPHNHEPLSVPLSIFSGQDDQAVSPQSMAGWMEAFSGEKNQVIFPGDHFYTQTQSSLVSKKILDLILSDLILLIKNRI
ncbi:thioesterase II family protein [Pandoraea sp. NPDC087047]|uniref:thioesterase II family protein n=1 Tax=Pandoraea sp. NPDC087047 TaxID=3364390 RepID=UPI003817C73E